MRKDIRSGRDGRGLEAQRRVVGNVALLEVRDDGLLRLFGLRRRVLARRRAARLRVQSQLHAFLLQLIDVRLRLRLLELVGELLLDHRVPRLELRLLLLGVHLDAGLLFTRDRELFLVIRVHLVADPGRDQHDHTGDGHDRLDRRVLLLVLHLEAHALLVDAHLALDAGAALGLLQPQATLALALFVGLASHTRALGLFPSPTLFRFAGGAIRRLFGLALCLGLRARGLLLLLDPVVLDPAQLAQRKQNRVLTWTLAAAHERGLTISVTRFSVDFNAPSLGRSTLARKSEASATVGDVPGIENDLLRLLERREQFVDDVAPLLPTAGLRAGLPFVIRAALRDCRLRILLARAVVRAAVATAGDRRRLRVA